MSSICKRIVIGIALLAGSRPLLAQDSADIAARQQNDMRAGIAEPDCAIDPFQRDTIVVCGEVSAEETQRHMSVLPAPVESGRLMVREIHAPPCWVEPTGGVCLRGGWAPPPVVLIDLDRFPDALTPEEEALVVRVENPEP